MSGTEQPRGPFQRAWAVVSSWRVLSVVLLSFSSGLPLGLVWIAIPAWMARVGVDIKVVGLFTLAQAPWSFKFLWSPLMDRYVPPGLGRKRGWMLLSQVALFAFTLWLAGVSDHPEAVWVIGALALAIGLSGATQDVAYDGYTVEVLRPGEQGLAVGARTAAYRLAMFFSGGLSITLASTFDVDLFGHTWFTYRGSWAIVNLVLALLYVPCMLITWRAPEPEALPPPPRSLKEAVWGPFLGLLGQHRALEILAFVVLFKLSDNLTQALLRPFFVQIGFNDVDVGFATMTIGTAGVVVGVLLGGLLTNAVGLGRALWISGLLQMTSNLGYALLADVGHNRPVLYGAQAFEYLTSGLGTGAFGVLLLRLTDKRFSATQYALLSSLFSLPRVLAGPPTGLMADALGWRAFFVLTVAFGLPGLWMLARFVPWNARDVEFHVAPPFPGRRLGRAGVMWRSAAVGGLAFASGAVALAALAAVKLHRAGKGFDLSAQVFQLIDPASTTDVVSVLGLCAFAGLAAVAAAALLVARGGVTPATEWRAPASV